MPKQITAEVKTDTFAFSDLVGNAVTISPVINDTTLFMFRFREIDPLTGVYVDQDLTKEGGNPKALRLLIREERNAASTLYAFQDVYNNGDFPTFEDLTSGQVTFLSAWTAAAASAIGTLESINAWLEVSFLDFNDVPSTLFASEITIFNEVDDGAAGTPPPSSPTYLTADEIAASYLAIADNGFWGDVIDKDLTAAPGSPTLGDRYIVGAGATGAWAGKDDQIAVATSGGGWSFWVPREGWTAWLNDEDNLYTYNSSWTTFTDTRYLQRGDANAVPTTELTVAAGAVTRTQWKHTVDTEGDAATDDLDTISGATDGDLLTLYLENAARVVTIKHGTGNITTSNGVDIVMAANQEYTFYFDGSAWLITPIGVGDFVGPNSSTDNAIMRYDGTTGKLGQNSLVTISDAGAITLPAAGVISAATSFTVSAGGASQLFDANGLTVQGIFNLTSVSPTIQLTESDASADNKTWYFDANSELFRFRTFNDAITAGREVYRVERTGINVDCVAFVQDSTSPTVLIATATKFGSETLGVNGDAYIAGAIEAVSTGVQLALTHTDGSVYTEMYTASNGKLMIDPTGGAVNIDGDLETEGLIFDPATELTIASGSVTATQAMHKVDTEGDAASDDLDTIVASSYAGVILVRAENAARTVTLKDGTGNLELGGADIELDNANKYAILVYDTVLAKWLIAGGSAVSSFDYIDLNTGLANPAHQEGRLFYDDSQKCMASYNDETDFTHQFGRETTLRVKNTTGVTIPDGKVVYISGQNVAGVPLVALAKADAPSTANAVGITTTSIANNTEGEVTLAGTVNGLDLSALSENDPVYLSAAAAGEFTDTPPSTPNIQIQLGTVSFSNVSTGSLVMDIRWFGIESDYAEISVSGNAVATAVAASNTWYQVTVYDTNGVSQGATPDQANDHIEINKTAAYSVSATASFSGGLNDVYQLAIYKNNGATRLNDAICERKMNSNGDIGVVSMECICDLVTGDTIELWINNNTDTDDPTVKHTVLRVNEVGNLGGASSIGNIDVEGITLSAATELTISSGSVTATRGLHRIDTEGDAGTDDLDTIVASTYAGLLMVRAENSARSVVLKDGTGNLELGGSDITLDDTNRMIILQYDTALSKWLVAGDGGGSGGSSGGMTLVERKTISTATTSVTFSSLDGDTDRNYILRGRVVNALSTASIGCYMNGDTTPGNYSYQFLQGSGSSATAGQAASSTYGMQIGTTRASGAPVKMSMEIDAATGFPRIGIMSKAEMSSTTQINYLSPTSYSWNNTATNLTSIEVTASATNGLGSGTVLELWKLN